MAASSVALIMLLLVCALAAAALLYVVALSRHRKSAAGDFELSGMKGLVETALEPQGTVLVRGELWPARSRTGARIERGQKVRVVGASGHRLEVEMVE